MPKLIVISDIDYDKDQEAFLEFQKEYSWLTVGEEKLFKSLDDEKLVWSFNTSRERASWEKYNRLLEDRERLIKARRDYCEIDEDIAREKALLENDIAAYFSTVSMYNVRDGKIYTRMNLLKGKFAFIKPAAKYMLLKNKNKQLVPGGILKDIDIKSIVRKTDLIINTTTEYSSVNIYREGYDWKQETLKYVESLDPELYVYTFYCSM